MEEGKKTYINKNIQNEAKKILPHIFDDNNIIEYICECF